MKFVTLFFSLDVFTMPALAFDVEEIGTLKATFGEESITLPTIIATPDEEASPTAFFMVPGGAFIS